MHACVATYPDASCVCMRACVCEQVGDLTTTYKIGPVIETGEVVTLVALDSGTTAYNGNLHYPKYSGLCDIGGAVGAPKLAGSTADKDIYAGLTLEITYRATLAQAVLDKNSITGFGDTVIDLTAAVAGYPQIVAGVYIKIENEVMYVSSITAPNTLNVVRGQFNTAEALHQTVGLTVTVLGYAQITSYNPATKVLTLSSNLPFAPTTTDGFKIFGPGTGSTFDLSGVTRAVYNSLPNTFSTLQTPPQYNTATVTLIDESAGARTRSRAHTHIHTRAD